MQSKERIKKREIIMEREERKRRIVARGTDRMALITGRIQTLDSNLISSSSFSVHTSDHVAVQHTRSSSSEPADPAYHVQALSQDFHHGRDDENISGDDASKNRSPESNKTSDEYNHSQKEPGNLLGSITLKDVNLCIVSSESTRVICSIAIAVLVVLTNVNVPHNVVTSKSLIAYRPLYVVLLIDVLVVAARLAPYAQMKVGDNEPETDEDGDNWGGAIRLLELGLVLHQAVRAIFIDCSFYLVIVICGLSLV